MDANKPDIQQIRKYLNGELDVHAMYQLERQAQQDPFLWDVIKGMESGENHQPDLDTIDKLIQQRVEKDRRAVVPLWKMVSVAASLLIALGVGGWLFINHQAGPPKVAQNSPVINPPDKVKVNTPVVAKPAAIEKPLLAQVNRKPPQQTVVTTPRVSAQANDAPVAQYQSRVDTSLFVRKTTIIDTGRKGMMLRSVNIKSAAQASLMAKNASPSANSDYLKYKSKNTDTALNRLLSQVAPDITLRGRLNQKAYKKDTATFSRNLSARVAGVQVTTPDMKSREYMQRVTGHVFDQDSHEGLPGVSVKVTGDQVATQTDAAGKFTITVPKGKETLSIGYIGYNNKQVKVTGQDSVNVTLAPSSAQLSEVVVTGYGTVKKEADDESVEDAHPTIGWKAYNKYLKGGATIPDGRVATVKLSFTIGANGAISNIKIVKGLSDDMNQKAIQLIQNGSAWIPASDHKPQVVTQKIQFHK